MRDPRLEALSHWLKSELQSDIELTPILGDASFRRYFRIFHEGQTFVAADAPPDKEASYPFVAIARSFSAMQINVPHVFLSDLDQGFLLLSDFGDELYQGQLNNENADELYGRSLEELVKIQTCQTISDWKLPHFDQAVILQELTNFRVWFLEKHLQLTINHQVDQLLEQLFEKLIDSAISQPQCCIHRDYHSRNLMVLPNKIGVLDFQDAAWGPVTYDAVSLLRDCYITWPKQDVERWALSFCNRIREKGFFKASDEAFLHWFDWMGIQRHLKAIFIFARKYHRDNTPNYLQYIPNGLKYIMDVSQHYPELKFFYDWMCDKVLPCYELVNGAMNEKTSA